MAGSDELPNYAVVPLKSQTILVAALQMSAKLVDIKNPKPGMISAAPQSHGWISRISATRVSPGLAPST